MSMSEKLKLRIAPSVAAFVRAGLTGGEKLAGLEAVAAMSAAEHVTLLFCLMRDADERVKEAGTAAFVALPEALLVSCIAVPGVHPAILDSISQFHQGKPAVVSALLDCPALSREARTYLGRVSVPTVPASESGVQPSLIDADAGPAEDPDDLDDIGSSTEKEQSEQDSDFDSVADDDSSDLEPAVEDDEHLSKYRLIQMMGIGEKIKMALTGDKEWRSILVNDTNKLVSSSVIRNPRITDGEILRILKVGVQNDEIVRLICDNREWVKNPLIRKALVDCPKTPLPNALRYLATLGDKEIAAYAKSRNISSVISTAAKRMKLAKKR